MKIHIMPQFLEDLRSADDSRFVRKVISQVIDEGGNFKRGQDDHRFHGIDDCWIRYITGGKTAYRLIFIQRGDDVFLYRAGQHSVEDNLNKPTKFDEAFDISSVGITQSKQSNVHFDDGIILKNSNQFYLKKALTSLFHIGHKEIYLVSPFVSEALLDKFAPFGRFLDKVIEEGTEIYLVTLPPERERIPFYEDLEARGINVYFYTNLHAKLYLFEINPATYNQYTKDISDTAIIGSANLTESGFGLDDKLCNEELCYRLPISKYAEAKDYTTWLVLQSTDLITHKSKYLRRF